MIATITIMQPVGALNSYELVLTGHLTSSSLTDSLAPLAQVAQAAGTSVLLVDCTTMVDYDLAARSKFTQWIAKHRGVLACVAVVTSNRIWHMVVSAMSLATGMGLRAFDDRAEAQRWLEVEGNRRQARSLARE